MPDLFRHLCDQHAIFKQRFLLFDRGQRLALCNVLKPMFSFTSGLVWQMHNGPVWRWASCVCNPKLCKTHQISMVYMKYILTWSEHKASAISDAASIAFLGQWPLVARSCLSAFIHYISLPHVSNMLISVADGTPRTITCARHGRSSKQCLTARWWNSNGVQPVSGSCVYALNQNVCNRNAIPDINHQRPTAINETHREWKKSNHRFWCPISSHPTVVGKLLDNTASIEQYRTGLTSCIWRLAQG